MLSRETARLIGFSDEFEKLAAPRWKKMLRAGKLDEVHKNILRRLRVSDPAMESLRGSGMVRERAAHAADPKVFRKAFQQSTGQVPSTALNYSKEIAGLERGSEAIAKKKGIRIIEGSFPKAMRQADRAREALRKGDLRGVTSHGKAALTEGIGSLSTVGGGGLAIPFGKKPTILLNPLTNAIAVSAGAIPGTRARKGILAVTKRHEVNEQLAGAAQKATGGRTSGWYITRPPSGDLEEAMSKDLAEKAIPYARVVERLGQGAGAVESAASKHVPLVGKLISHGASKVKQKSQDILKIVNKLKTELPAGKHMSPDVIMRESKDVATMPSRVQSAFRKLRNPAEMRMMGNRFEYGTAPSRSVRKQIMGGFNRGEI